MNLSKSIKHGEPKVLSNGLIIVTQRIFLKHYHDCLIQLLRKNKRLKRIKESGDGKQSDLWSSANDYIPADHGGIGSSKVANSIRGVSKYNIVTGRIYHGLSDIWFGNIAPYTGY